MAEDTKPFSPMWWVRRLESKLGARAKDIKLYSDYYEGKHRLQYSTEKFRMLVGPLFEDFCDNWCDLVVNAVEERLNVEGFRFGEGPAGDKDAWRMWQENNLDSQSLELHKEALICSEASAIVWEQDGAPRISVEHPNEVIVEHAPGSRRERRAALKRWVDDGRAMATLYLPDATYKFQSRSKTGAWMNAKVNEQSWVRTSTWERRETNTESWPLNNALGVVPVVPFYNDPRMLIPGHSEIARVIPLQDAVNTTIKNMLYAAELGAMKQRWATGMDIPRDPKTGEEIEPFNTAVKRLWIAEDPETKFGEFSETQLSNFVAATEMLVQHIASQTRTPPHYFYLSGQFPSGESIKSAETGLVAKTKRKMRPLGESWEEVIRLGFGILDDRRSKDLQAETKWADPESRSESEHVDAVTKMKGVNVPTQKIWELLGFTPQEIQRFKEMLRQEALESDIFAPPPAAVPEPPADDDDASI